MSTTSDRGARGLETVLLQVHLEGAAAVLPAWLARAAEQELGYADFLQGLLAEELATRATAAAQRRLRDAAFPFAATIEQFDFRFRPELKRQVVLRYLDPTFVEQAGTLTLIGPPGLGKTMLAICVATKQVQLGYTARFVTAQALASGIGRAATSLGRQRILKPLLACDVLVLDELGYLPTESSFGPALYEVIAGRYQRRPTIVTSNKSLTDWAQIVQDVSLAAALVDRLMHHGQVFYLRGPSWRTKDRPDPAAARGACWVTKRRKGGEKMRTKTPTVWEDPWRGHATLENGPRLDTPAWVAWLEDPATTSFAYPVDNPGEGYIEGFMTVRKERRARGGAYWTAYWRVGGQLRKAYLGRADAVTMARLRAIAAAWLAQRTPMATDFPRPAGAR